MPLTFLHQGAEGCPRWDVVLVRDSLEVGEELVTVREELGPSDALFEGEAVEGVGDIRCGAYMYGGESLPQEDAKGGFSCSPG